MVTMYEKLDINSSSRGQKKTKNSPYRYSSRKVERSLNKPNDGGGGVFPPCLQMLIKSVDHVSSFSSHCSVSE